MDVKELQSWDQVVCDGPCDGIGAGSGYQYRLRLGQGLGRWWIDLTDKRIAAAVGIIRFWPSIDLGGTEQCEIAADSHRVANLIARCGSSAGQHVILEVCRGLKRPYAVILESIAECFALVRTTRNGPARRTDHDLNSIDRYGRTEGIPHYGTSGIIESGLFPWSAGGGTIKDIGSPRIVGRAWSTHHNKIATAIDRSSEAIPGSNVSGWDQGSRRRNIAIS